MFTGIIQKIGIIKRISRGAGLAVEVEFEPWEEPLELGESVAVDGVCLTVAKRDERHFTAHILAESEERTTFSAILPGRKVHLERALRAGAPIGGHIVQGHVDTCGVVSDKIEKGRDFQLRVSCGRVLAAQSVLKGSIAINGASLTISAIGDNWLGVDIIPTTAKATTIGALKVGDRVNLEGDIIGKYLAKCTPTRAITEAKLMAAGFI